MKWRGEEWRDAEYDERGEKRREMEGRGDERRRGEEKKRGYCLG